MNEIPLTKEQREFAAEHHNLIYAFLNTKRLPEEEYYDIVVFGYLRAVKDYLDNQNLQRYSFATLSWRKMNCLVLNHYTSLNRQMRKGSTISLESILYGEEPLYLEEILAGPDRIMEDLEAQLMLHDLATKVTRQQMEIVHQRNAGYCLREIAKGQHTTVKHIQELLREAGAALLALGYGVN